MATGLVFNIQKCSIHDGPGIRTLVFIKGCPLRCLWCANPESQHFQPDVVFNSNKCISCNACIERCPEHCIEAGGATDFSKCTSCGQCMDVCYAEARKFTGEEMTPEQVVDIVKKDAIFYSQSNGGVTFSGGEPLCSPEFLYACASKCKHMGISTAIETCGYGDYERFKPVLDCLDMIYFDVKHIDHQVHKQLTGVSNEVILGNLQKIDTHHVPIHIRIPVIPTCNADVENLLAIATMVSKLHNVVDVELLAYHKLGVHKYHLLGREYGLENIETPTVETMEGYVAQMNAILTPSGKRCFYQH